MNISPRNDLSNPVFECLLNRVQDAPMWRSEKTKEANILQALFDKANTDDIENSDPNQPTYEKVREKMESEGKKFRLTEDQIWQIFPTDETLKVPIRLQIKEGTITWYFEGPMDVTTQEFRDEVYLSAGLGHLKVKNACEKYLRGTNALHVLKMHTSEAEAGLNHNHYRLEGKHGDVTPTDLREHLTGFVEAEKALHLTVKGSAGEEKEKFLDMEEVESIIRDYEKHWAIINHKGPAQTVEIHGEMIQLPYRPTTSILEEYKESEHAKWTPEDEQEWEEFKGLEAPCRELQGVELSKLPLEKQIEYAKKSMRGLKSENALLRQVPGSKHKVIKTKYKKDDKIIEVASIALTAIPKVAAIVAPSAGVIQEGSIITPGEPKNTIS